MLNREIILEKLRAVKPELQSRYGLTELGLFGSFARNEQNSHSDIDLIVALSEPSFKNYCRVSEAVESLFPGMVVQTVSRGAIKPAYFERLKNDIIYA